MYGAWAYPPASADRGVGEWRAADWPGNRKSGCGQSRGAGRCHPVTESFQVVKYRDDTTPPGVSRLLCKRPGLFWEGVQWKGSSARRIRTVSPESKILFVSQESSADVVQEALRLGALGYVAKTDAGSELLTAVEAICQGGRFVSAGLVGQVPAERANRQVQKPLHLDQVHAPQPEAGD